MCGIAGWLLRRGETRDEADLRAMADAIAHRGPDDRGYFRDSEHGVALAHNRLSIIDLSAAGHQPLLTQSSDVVLVYNGELYNFASLRSQLEEAGHRFVSRTDSEVVLKAFVEWGPACLERFCGMFAFAAWSARDRKLFLARDPLGMKPLYYTSLPRDQGFVFASEIKAFLALRDFKPRLNSEAVQQFLEFGYTFDEHTTVFEGVCKLPPGSSMEVVGGSVRPPQPYFELPRRPANERGVGEAEADLYETLSEVVGQHLIADVPVGLLLSGGLYSSITAALAARKARVTTISMGFAESTLDERPYARIVAKHIRSDHREVTIEPRAISDTLEEVAWYFDDLFADWGTVSTRILYRTCRDMGIKVVLVGEGSDEIFGGYPIFDATRRLRGPMGWRLFQLYRRYAGRRHGGQFWRFARIMRKYLRDSDGDWFQAVRLFETRNQLPNNYVMKVDKASMSVSVEARAPFLDRRVAELAFSMTGSQLLGPEGPKAVLRSMAERFALLPAEITRRPKMGSSMAAGWMKDSATFRTYAKGVILDRDSWVDRLGLRHAMTDYFEENRLGYAFPHGISIFSNLAWRLLLLNLWSRRYMRV
jgi:asparagine synthase (glutamine-hydrolysing)